MDDLHHQDDLDDDEDHIICSNYQKEQRLAAVKSNDAFVARMNRAIAKGREKVKAGTFVDLTPPVSVMRPRGSYPMSACGSPAAMCMESGGAQSGAESMK